MSPKARRLAFWIPVAVVLIAAIVYAFWPQPVAVDLATVEKGRLRVTIEEEGRTRVREVYQLSAPVSGRLLRIHAKVGDAVEGGKTEVARIESAPPAFLDVRTESEARAAVEAARGAKELAVAERDRARAELEFTASDLKRVRALFDRGTVAQQRLDEAVRAQQVAKANLQTAQASMDVKEHELQVAQARLMSRDEMKTRESACECIVLRAPVDGTVLRVVQESETVVTAGQVLMEFGDPRDLEVVVDLLSQDAVRVDAGQSAIIEDWGGPPLDATVQRVEPYGYTKVSALGIEEQRVNVILDLRAPAEAFRRLGHGYRVNVAILLHDAEVLRVPLGALFRDGSAWKAFVLKDGRAVAQTVEIGHRNDTSAEVKGGLQAGDRVVLYPSDRVSNNTRIEQR